jgi:hypothetical protein
MTHLEAALGYARIGIPVLPLHVCINGVCSCGIDKPHKKGKHPRYRGPDLMHGVKSATRQFAKIQEWWGLWPDANIGGALPQHVYVTEIDSAAGLMAFTDAGIVLEGVPRVRTGRDGLGLHCWWRSPLALPNCPDGTLVQDVGLRGHGEYVLMPPSLHPSSRRYIWEIPFAGPIPDSLPEAPPSLVALVQHAKGQRLYGGGRLWQSAFTPVPPGQQAVALLSLAGHLLRHLPKDGWPAITIVLAEAAKQYPLGEVGWPWRARDFERIVAQAYDRMRLGSDDDSVIEVEM